MEKYLQIIIGIRVNKNGAVEGPGKKFIENKCSCTTPAQLGYWFVVKTSESLSQIEKRLAAKIASQRRVQAQYW